MSGLHSFYFEALEMPSAHGVYDEKTMFMGST